MAVKLHRQGYMQQLVFQNPHWRYGAVSKFLLGTVEWFDIGSVKPFLNLRDPRLPRRVILAAGRIGTMFQINVKGFINLNEPHPRTHPHLHEP
jgi:hypothetical protein